MNDYSNAVYNYIADGSNNSSPEQIYKQMCLVDTKAPQIHLRNMSDIIVTNGKAVVRMREESLLDITVEHCSQSITFHSFQLILLVWCKIIRH